jgi:hypothetical protein
LSHLPRTSYTAGACSLGHRACNACPFGLALFADVGLFSVASPLPPLMLASGFAAPWPRSFDRAGPMRPHWASLATGLGKADGEPRMARVVPAVRPYVAHGATRTGDTLGVPSHRNTREGKALPRVRLPGRLPLDRPHDCDAVVGLTGDEDWGGAVAPGEQRCRGQKVVLLEGVLPRLRPLVIVRSRRGRCDRREPVRPLTSTGGGTVRCRPAPGGRTWLTVPGCGSRRSMHPMRRGGPGIGVAPVPFVLWDIRGLQPYAPPPVHRRMLPPRGRDPVPPWPAILAHVPCPAWPGTVRRREAVWCQTWPLPVIPCWGHPLLPPWGGHVGQTLQGRAPRGADTLPTVAAAGGPRWGNTSAKSLSV